MRTLRVAGRLDRSFSADGWAVTDFRKHVDGAEAVALGQGGTIVAAGWSSIPQEERVEFALSRYRPDGSLDAGFGRGGRVITDFGVRDYAENLVHDIVVGPDGRITAVGQAGVSFENEGMGVARYLPDGSLDPSFGGGDGVVIVRKRRVLEECPVARSVAPTPDGGLVLAGSTGCGGEAGGMAVAVVRLTADGALDASFARGGVRTFDFGHCATANAVALQRDGKIVVGASDGGCYERRSPFRVARLNPDGSTDASFGRRGRVRVDFERGQSGVLERALDSRDRMLLAGAADDRFAVARLTRDGRLDARFGTGGKLLSDIARGRNAIPAAIVPARRGRFVVAGTVYTRSGDAERGVVVIYRSNGAPARSATLSFPGGKSDISDLAVDRHGRLVAAGAAGGDFAVARLR
jgi:uncharacterized delta-60 repeat protein